MHSLLEITLFFITHNLRNAPKAEEITNGTCFDPERNSYYTPKFGFCVYGINYEVNDDAVTFDEKLYFNYDQLFNDGDMTVDEFETAAKPLCDKIPYDDITKYVTYYYGAWVKTKNNTYKDMFIGCCKLCQMLSSINWLITLKIQMMALSKFALIRKDVLLYQKKMISFFDTNYLTAEYNRIPPCESSNYDLIPVLLGNPIGFASGFDRLSWESLLLRSIAPHREPVTYIGRYTSAIANEYKQNHCLNSYALKPYSVCLVYLLLTKEYGYECCCYGDEIPQCQERIRNAIIIGPSVGVFRRRKTPCVIDEDSLDHNSKVTFSVERIEFKGDVYNLMNHMERNFCELHLKFNGTEQINVSFNSNFTKQRLSLLYQQASKITERITISLVNKSYREQQSTSNQSIFWSINNMKDYDSERAKDYYKKLIEQSINITNSFQCVNLSNWDARAHDILQFNCAQLLPIDAQCPFSSSRNLEHQHIMCCCGHRSFCNYNADMIKRASAKSFPDLCEYNNEYQYFLHDYFYPTKLDANHSCLLHFVSGNALNDMSQLFSKENSIIFFLPGSAIQPIDFSYALLKPNECDYLDVDLKRDYLRTRYCYESTKLLKYFETEFMPMRLFACRCETTPGEARCDSILKQNIAEKAKNSKRKYYCAVYSDQHSVKFNYKPKFKVNDLSPYCATMLDFRTIGDNFYYTFSGNMARRTFINKLKFQLAMIPYTMYKLSGEATQLCMQLVAREMILCICRNKYTNRRPCNFNPYQKGKTLQFAIHQINLSKSRKTIPNELATYTTSKEPKWCHSKSIFSTIIINSERKKTEIIGACVKKTSKFNEEESRDLLCAERLLYEECGLVSESDPTSNTDEEMLVCCCDDNCDSTGLQLYEFNSNIQFSMEG